MMSGAHPTDPPPTAGHPDADAPTGPTRDEVARRIQRFEQTMRSRVTTTSVPLPFGMATLSPDLPLVYVASGIEVTRPAAVSEVLDLVESTFANAGLRHRRVMTTVPEVAWCLAPALADRGWDTERLVTMVHDGRTAPSVSPVGFDVVDVEAWLPACRRFAAGTEWGRDPAVQESRSQWDRRLAERVGARFVLDADGVAGCHVYRHGQFAQIESVNVLAEARGQGLGQGVMAAAMAQCEGAGLVFLTAHAGDWPRHWYRRLGFEPVGPGWDWILDPPTS